MGSGLDSYKFGRKNNWRRTIWKEARERLIRIGCKIKDCTVVYLPGPENNDYKVAINNGFKPWNLFAIDKDDEVVKNLRLKKYNIVQSDFNEALCAWPLKNKIDFLFADFCSGITNNAITLIFNLLFSGSISSRCVVAVNLLRGRDGNYLNHYSNLLKDLSKNRGKIFYRILMSEYITHVARAWSKNHPNVDRKIIASQATKFANRITDKICFPKTYEYKSPMSGHNYMDSIVFNWGSSINFDDESEKIFAKTESITDINEIKSPLVSFNVEFGEIAHRISAAKAINTMKRNNLLGGFS